MSRPFSVTVGVLAVLVATSASAEPSLDTTPRSQAESGKADVRQLSTVTVKGDRQDAALPEGSTVIRREQLESRAITGWEDLGKRGDPAINFSRQTKSVNIRGMDQDRVAVRVDGIRLPWLTDGARGEKGGLGTVNFSGLSAIDVLGAAGASQTGSLAGLVDLRTLAPDDLLRDGKPFGALLKSGYDGADASWNADAALAGEMLDERTKWLIQVGYRRGDALENQGDVGGYGPKREKANPSSYTQRSAMLKLQHDLTSQYRLIFSAETFRWENEIDNLREQGTGTSYLAGHNGVEERQQRDRLVAGFDFRSGANIAAVEQGQVRVYWQRSSVSSEQSGLRTVDARASIVRGDPFRYGFPSGYYARNNSVEEKGYGLTTTWSGTVPTEAIRNHWQAGLDGYVSRTTQASAGEDNCPVIRSGLAAPFGPRSCDLLHSNQSDVPEVDGRQWALWAQNEMSWADGRFAVTPALRFDAYHYSAQSTSSYQSNPNAAFGQLDSNSGQRVSPSIKFAWQPAEQAKVYVSYGYGYKVPNASQLYMNYGPPGTYLRVGNPDLKAEVSRGWELGAELGNQKLGGSLAFFDNHYRDFIDENVTLTPASAEWNPAWTGQYPMGVTAFANRARVRIYGAQARIHGEINPNWYAWSALAWANGKDLDTGRYLNSVAPLKTIVGVGYKQRHWGAEAILTAAKRRSRVEDPGADFQAPGYGVVDLTAWWQPSGVKGLRVQAGVFNLFDRTYWSALNVPQAGSVRSAAPVASYTEPGRHARVWLTYQY